MTYHPQLAAIRFGTGLAPDIAPPKSVPDMLARLQGPDAAALAHPITTLDAHSPRLQASAKANMARKQAAKLRSGERAAVDEVKAMRREFDAVFYDATLATLSRSVTTEDGFRERLNRFWADHFTIAPRRYIYLRVIPAAIEEAIRPRITGAFEDLFVAAVTNPLMLSFLNQAESVGPDSESARKKEGRGLNENLAREILELHAFGVGGPYAQGDVQALALALTGISHDKGLRPIFKSALAQPGQIRVLGHDYGIPDSTDAHRAETVLRDIARHPATARHIAWKLVRHFVSDDPDQELINALSERFLDTSGDLMAVYEALLNHPAAWTPQLYKIKQPIDYLSSGLRALGAAPQLATLTHRSKPVQLKKFVFDPLTEMGQRFMQPNGPDGWPEEQKAWITPQGLAARIDWAMTMPDQLLGRLPDPRSFVEIALGSHAPPDLHQAVAQAESVSQGIGLVLASPEFQRR